MDINVNNTLFTGKFLLHLPTVDSTNNYAKEWIAKNSPINGTVIIADEQVAGRGQKGNVWISEAGKNLTFSVIYKTDFLLATEQFWLNIAVSLGVWSAVEKQLNAHKEIENGAHSLPTKTSIKWPNDIYVSNEKIAGILIENTIQGQYLKQSVIGIGCNVNQQHFPENLNATSLCLLLKNEIDKLSFFLMMLEEIERFYLLLKERKLERLKKEYIDNLFRYNVTSNYKKDEILFEGKIIDVDANGYLVMETENGIQQFGFKEISFVI
ncbi:MAG: biotin--[acetyl-CoA-carboxylase] ligase [Bacteroidetes bacterium]|nr:biotin--[acetyl-CoA-carboxylase] ligase [Bacteroidota bacterium]